MTVLTENPGPAGGLLLLTNPCSLAEPASPDDKAEIIADELKSQDDPTLLLRRVWSDTE